MDIRAAVVGQEMVDTLRRFADQIESEQEQERRSVMPADKVLGELRSIIEKEMEVRAVAAETENAELKQKIKETEMVCLQLELASEAGLGGLTEFDHRLLTNILDDPNSIAYDPYDSYNGDYYPDGWSQNEIRDVIQGVWLSGINRYGSKPSLAERLKSPDVTVDDVISYLRYRMGTVDEQRVAELLGGLQNE